MYDAGRKDKNWIAYRTDLGAGKLDNFMGQYVAYHQEKFLTASPTRDDLLQKVRAEFGDLAEIFLHQVGVDKTAQALKS